MNTAQVLGWVATFLFSIMVIPQIIKTIKSKDTKGVSLLMFMVFLVANIIALVYAIMISQPPLIIKYIVAIITTVIYIGIFLYYYTREKRIKQVIKKPINKESPKNINGKKLSLKIATKHKRKKI